MSVAKTNVVKKQILITIAVLLFLAIGTTIVILYGRGYRFGSLNGRPELSGTGLLVATSTPDGAGVYINGHLTTATDNTINLVPGDYTVKISKDGYFLWEKKIKIQKEVVSKAEATLFPKAPKLESITSTGVQSLVIDPSLSRIAYTVASQSARKNGVYILDMSTKPILTLQSSSTQVVDDTIDQFSKATVKWSPDGQELLVSILGVDQKAGSTEYLLSSTSFNQNPKDVTATLDNVLNDWRGLQQEKERAQLDTLKPMLRNMMIENFHVLSNSPDETKVLYQASSSATLPVIIIPRLIGTNPTPEERTLEKGKIYVYDIKEDRNYKLNIENLKMPSTRTQAEGEIGNSQSSQALSWFPDSKHLVHVSDKKIDILEFDATNNTTVYAGPFVDNYVFPWPNGSKILILTNLGNESISPNLYTIDLK